MTMTKTLDIPSRPRSARLVTVSASGPDPDRVLVFGDAAFAPDQRLDEAAQQMADAMAARSGRGSDVTAVPWSSWTGQTLLSAANGARVVNFDVVVVCLTDSVVHERTTNTAVADAATGVLDLVDQLRTRLAPNAEIVVTLAHRPGWTAMLDALRRTRADLVVLGFDADAITTAPPLLLEVVNLLLDGQRSRAGSPQWLRSTPQPFRHRYDAIRRLGIVDAPADAALDRMVQQMTELFRTTGAAITFLPEGRQWSAASLLIPRGTGALQDSFCRSTVLGPGPLVIGDAWEEHRPQIVRRGRIRFYAGHPLEDLDGTRIGAVCVFDPAPRRETAVELDLLRDFAVQARRALYGR